MVLTIDVKRRILDLISIAPCSVQELAFALQKNWRTVDNYLSKLQEEGLVSIKEFKRGQRVAFKIIYIQPDINTNISNIQKQLLKKIETGRRSQDFSPLDIIQYLEDKAFHAYFKSNKISTEKVTEDLASFLNQATKTILMFSGDLSWIELTSKKGNVLNLIENLAKQKVSIKIIARVDKTTKNRIEKLLNINYKLGNDYIEIHHEEHPLRCFIIDNQIARLKEPAFSSQKGKLEKIGTYFYQITNESWINWLERLFWSTFRSSIPAEKRLQILDKIEDLKSN